MYNNGDYDNFSFLAWQLFVKTGSVNYYILQVSFQWQSMLIVLPKHGKHSGIETEILFFPFLAFFFFPPKKVRQVNKTDVFYEKLLHNLKQKASV